MAPLSYVDEHEENCTDLLENPNTFTQNHIHCQTHGRTKKMGQILHVLAPPPWAPLPLE